MTARDREPRRSSGQIDLWLAFAAGSDAWDEAEPPAEVTDQATRLIEVVALITAAAWPLLWTTASGVRLEARDVFLFVLLCASVGLLVWSVVRRQTRPVSPARRAVGRVILGGGAAAGFAGLAPDLAVLGAWPFGVAAGADIARTSLALDVPLQPRHWVRRLVLSPAHAGVACALAVGWWVLGSRSGVGRLVLLYAAGWTCVVVAWATATVVCRADERRRRSEREVERQIVEREHRRRGHWLHDDVCSDLRSVRLRIEGGALADDDVAGLLDDLEHRLRMRQLDEFIDAGAVRLAEVIQPYLRRAKQEGIEIVESPTLETAGELVSGDCARLVQRAMGVFVPNAVHSGSPELAVRLVVRSDHIVVEVEDAGGGFDLTAVPPGRGLDRLRHELGPDALEQHPTARGSVLRATIPREPRRTTEVSRALAADLGPPSAGTSSSPAPPTPTRANSRSRP